ncbi:MAG TPA: MDR family MFS transporter [Verrucomicrobiae bacterium]|nr:MDR family MFS transporter [Verrucomicrobiae bacterium]
MTASLDYRRGVAVSGVLLVIFLFAIDSTVVSAAMPTIVGKIGGLELYSWVFSSYMLTSALATPLFGNLSDLYGRRRLMLLGIGLFTLGSALCGAARSIEQLIVFRALQGVGGGAIYALSFILIGHLFPPERRARMQALVSGLWGIASILGPLVGAAITEFWDWRWIFFVNLPICLTAMLLIGFGIGGSESARRHQVDIKGLTFLMLGLLFAFYALEEARMSAFALDWSLGILAALAALSLAIFYRIERSADEPILPPSLLGLRLFKLCLALAWFASMGMFGVISYLPLYVQGGLGGDAASVGIALIPASLGWTAGSFLAGGGMNRYGYRAVCLAGSVLMLVGYALFVALEPSLGFSLVLAIGAVIGVGMGMVTLTSMVAAQNGVPHERLGVATSSVMLARMFGGAFGIALMGSVLFSRMQSRLAALSGASMAGAARGLIRKLASPEQMLDPALRASMPAALLASLEEVLRDSIRLAFAAGLAVTVITLAVSFLMIGTVDPGDRRGKS